MFLKRSVNVIHPANTKYIHNIFQRWDKWLTKSFVEMFAPHYQNVVKWCFFFVFVFVFLFCFVLFFFCFVLFCFVVVVVGFFFLFLFCFVFFFCFCFLIFLLN